MALPTHDEITLSIGQNLMKYADLQTRGINPKRKHVLFFINASTIIGSLYHKHPELSDPNVDVKYTTAILIEMLNVIGHYRNYFTRHQGCKFSCFVYPGSYQNFVNGKAVFERLNQISHFIPWLYIFNPPEQDMSSTTIHKMIAAIAVRIQGRIYTKGGDIETIFYSNDQMDLLQMRIDWNTKIICRKTKKSDDKIFRYFEVSSNVDGTLPRSEYLAYIPFNLASHGQLPIKIMSANEVVKINSDVIELIKNEGLGRSVYDLTKLLLSRFVNEKKFAAADDFFRNVLYELDPGIIYLADNMIKLWRSKLHDRGDSSLGEYLSNLSVHSNLKIEWIL